MAAENLEVMRWDEECDVTFYEYDDATVFQLHDENGSTSFRIESMKESDKKLLQETLRIALGLDNAELLTRIIKEAQSLRHSDTIGAKHTRVRANFIVDNIPRLAEANSAVAAHAMRVILEINITNMAIALREGPINVICYVQEIIEIWTNAVKLLIDSGISEENVIRAMHQMIDPLINDKTGKLGQIRSNFENIVKLVVAYYVQYAKMTAE